MLECLGGACDLSGSLVIAQSGGPTAVVNASLVGALRAGRAATAVDRVLGARFGAEGLLTANYADLDSLSRSEEDVLFRTPSAALGSSRHRPSDEELAGAALRLRDEGVRWLVMIGGNDSADTLHRLHLIFESQGSPISVVGIPKTIDNDLPAMDHTPGYGSAARYLAQATREAGLDTAAMQRTDPVKIIEVMGRNAGWLAGACALGRDRAADAPQLVFLPERPRSLQQMLSEIEGVQRRNGWVVVALSENQRDDEGRPLGGDVPVHQDPHGHPYFESPGQFLTRTIQAELGVRARYERPGSLQRTSSLLLSETDLAEAFQVGQEAVRLALSGRSDIMVTIERVDGAAYQVGYGAAALSEIARVERRMPDAFISDAGTDVTDAFRSYALPLLGGPLPPLAYLN